MRNKMLHQRTCFRKHTKMLPVSYQISLKRIPLTELSLYPTLTNIYLFNKWYFSIQGKHLHIIYRKMQ